ncbi:MAG: PQQ-dependent dehydrogenase, methanol/ethanol family [Halieaceae bacterium]|jgi:quinohemoprotein ethanol dehydrogenase|nr:PQQ-dependent dehydrogenase, methanol/ethanol family [Halieaceae bacterium]
MSILFSSTGWAAEGEWPLHGGDAGEQRYSPLEQINPGNVADLKLAWSYPLGSKRGVEATPIVADGVMYTTSSWSIVHALDARTGKPLWIYDPKVPGAAARKACCDVVNRGVALWRDRVFVGTLDGRLVALNRRTGEVIWSVVTVDQTQAYTITGAPRVVKGKVVIGNGGAELGVRGYVSAYSVTDGELVWRFYTVPGKPEHADEHSEVTLARKTWSEDSLWETGLGGTVWDSMAYDPQLNLLYVGTGNAANYNRAQRSPGGGDNLFLASILALNPDTGTMAWYYQTTPAESWDYTATQQMILAEIEHRGVPRKVLMQAPKNGFFYVLDRETGELLSAEPYTEMNWASHIDLSSGRPVESAVADWSELPRSIMPSMAGGHNWQPMSYNPKTGLVYIPTRSEAYLFYPDPDFVFRPLAFNTGENFPALDEKIADLSLRQCSPTQLSAWDPVAQQMRWQETMPTTLSAGVLSTAAGLVFQGRGDATFLAYDANNGKTLWQVATNTPIVAPPVSFSIEDEQFIAVSTGMGGGSLAFNPSPYENDGHMLVFSLQGKATMPPRIARPARTLNLPDALVDRVENGSSSAAIEAGRISYIRYCLVCHGVGASNPGALPDLRYASKKTHDEWLAVVLGGLRQDQGMASFSDSLNVEDAGNIQLYVVSRAMRSRLWYSKLMRWAIDKVCIPSSWIVD